MELQLATNATHPISSTGNQRDFARNRTQFCPRLHERLYNSYFLLWSQHTSTKHFRETVIWQVDLVNIEIDVFQNSRKHKILSGVRQKLNRITYDCGRKTEMYFMPWNDETSKQRSSSHLRGRNSGQTRNEIFFPALRVPWGRLPFQDQRWVDYILQRYMFNPEEHRITQVVLVASWEQPQQTTTKITTKDKNLHVKVFIFCLKVVNCAC